MHALRRSIGNTVTDTGTTTGLRGDPAVWRLGAPDQELTVATAGSTPHVDPGGREAREGVVLVNVILLCYQFLVESPGGLATLPGIRCLRYLAVG